MYFYCIVFTLKFCVFRIFRGKRGLHIHLKKSKSCNVISKGKAKYFCKCKIKEVWLVPSVERRSPWDCDFVTKDIFIEALGLVPNENYNTVEDNLDFYEEDDEPISHGDYEYDSSVDNLEVDIDKEKDITSDRNDNYLNDKCTDCSKTFSAKRNLQRHMAEIHSKEAHLCCGCGKIFSRRKYLLEHEEICLGHKTKQKHTKSIHINVNIVIKNSQRSGV